MVPPMTAIMLDHRDLERYLPHRGINILPDSMSMDVAGKEGRTTTRIAADDPRERQIFGRDDGNGNWVWNEPFLAELMALTGVPLLAEALAEEGKVSVFSMISKLSIPRLAPMDAEVVGHTRITRERRGFSSFSCQAYVGDELVLDSEVLSGAAPLQEIASAAVRPFAQVPEGDPVEPFSWKPREMTFIDTVISDDSEAGTLRAAYTYPDDHPLVPGHFPDAALMMGVTQWSAIADAAWVARQRFGIQGPIIATGTITREDGGQVVDVRGLRMEPGAGGTAVLSATQRIAFREPVRPGDGVMVDVTIAPAE